MKTLKFYINTLTPVGIIKKPVMFTENHDYLEFQYYSLKKQGYIIDPEIMDSLNRINEIAETNEVSYLGLVEYTFGTEYANDN